jgi:hypothetical protein
MTRVGVLNRTWSPHGDAQREGRRQIRAHHVDRIQPDRYSRPHESRIQRSARPHRVYEQEGVREEGLV